MSRDEVEKAIRYGIPFQIKTADGASFEVTDRLQVALGQSILVVVDDAGIAHVRSLLAVTGISYLRPPGQTGESGVR